MSTKMTILLRSMLVAIPLLSISSVSNATDVEAIGSDGGEPFRITCPAQHFLVGVTGGTGSWIDRIGPICAQFFPSQNNFGSPFIPERVRGGAGGYQTAATCPPTSLVHGWTIQQAHSRMVEFVALHCAHPLPPNNVVNVGRLMFGTESEPRGDLSGAFGSTAVTLHCPSGEVAVGIHGRSGVFIDKLGLICGPAPSAPGSVIFRTDPNETITGRTLRRERANLEAK